MSQRSNSNQTMKTVSWSDSIGIGDRARLGRSRRRARRWLLRACAPIISSDHLAKGSPRGRAERQPRRLRFPLLSSEQIPLRAVFIALTCAPALLAKPELTAQTFTTLYSFTAIAPNPGPYTNSDGANPGFLISSDNTLYGTAEIGGDSGGTVFRVNADGTGFMTLYRFDRSTGVNSDGAQPNSLLSSDNTLYGTAYAGGSSGDGTVFAVNTDGTGFTTLYSFTGGDDGAIPQNAGSGLVLSGNALYGTTENGGGPGSGTVFVINTDGTGFRLLHSFTGLYSIPTNSDGAYPNAHLILSGNTLYGTAGGGGSSGNGTVFSISLPVTPPQLTVIPSGANIILTWPTNATGFTLHPPRALFHRRSGPLFLRGQSSSTGRTQ